MRMGASRLKESQLQEAVRPLPGAACGYMGAAMLHMALLAGAGMAVVMAANGLLYHLEGLQDGALLAHQMAACVLYPRPQWSMHSCIW